jgi:two-component system, OmpR family, sensor kinase
MKRWYWSIALIPAALGILAAFCLWFISHRNPIAYLRIDLGSLSLLLALGLSALLATGLALWRTLLAGRQKLLSEAADERRRFLRRLDHELKNPLTAIRAGLANLAGSPSEAARQEALLSVDAQAQRLSRLAADLRTLAELEIRLVEHSPVDIPALLQEVFSLAQDQPGAGERRLTLSIPQAPWPLPKISGDQDLLFLAVHNLLENALKFSRPGDTVELHASEDGTSLLIEIADTGPGIPGEEQPHVFEELYRGEAGRGVPGSGLGLALVRAIAERHNGQVSLRSRPGQGTVFTLRLPVG